VSWNLAQPQHVCLRRSKHHRQNDSSRLGELEASGQRGSGILPDSATCAFCRGTAAGSGPPVPTEIWLGVSEPAVGPPFGGPSVRPSGGRPISVLQKSSLQWPRAWLALGTSCASPGTTCAHIATVGFRLLLLRLLLSLQPCGFFLHLFFQTHSNRPTSEITAPQHSINDATAHLPISQANEPAGSFPN
jgi:hypothetical protein